MQAKMLLFAMLWACGSTATPSESRLSAEHAAVKKARLPQHTWNPIATPQGYRCTWLTLNDLGQLAGGCERENPLADEPRDYHAAFWESAEAAPSRLTVDPEWGKVSGVLGVTEAGAVVGWTTGPGWRRIIRWTRDNGVWTATKAQLLYSAYPLAMNERGDVLALDSHEVWFCPIDGEDVLDWKRLGYMAADPTDWQRRQAMPTLGQTSDGLSTATVSGDWVWQDGEGADLPSSNVFFYPHQACNETGRVIGYAGSPFSDTEPALWTHEPGTMSWSLTTLEQPDSVMCRVEAIQRLGSTVVGQCARTLALWDSDGSLAQATERLPYPRDDKGRAGHFDIAAINSSGYVLARSFDYFEVQTTYISSAPIIPE